MNYKVRDKEWEDYNLPEEKWRAKSKSNRRVERIKFKSQNKA